MAERFVDRQSAYPNRYEWVDETGASGYFYLYRADEPTVPGTPLNASTFNAIVDELGNKIPSDGPIVLTEGIHYGDTLPPAGNKGRIFFLKKVTE